MAWCSCDSVTLDRSTPNRMFSRMVVPEDAMSGATQVTLEEAGFLSYQSDTFPVSTDVEALDFLVIEQNLTPPPDVNRISRAVRWLVLCHG